MTDSSQRRGRYCALRGGKRSADPRAEASENPERFGREPDPVLLRIERRRRPDADAEVASVHQVVPALAEVDARLDRRCHAVLAGRVAQLGALQPDHGGGRVSLVALRPRPPPKLPSLACDLRLPSLSLDALASPAGFSTP